MSKKLAILSILLLLSCSRQYATEEELEILLDNEKKLIEKKERLIAEINLFRPQLYKTALALYENAAGFIKAAAALQETIDTETDADKKKELEGRRDGLLESAKKSFQAGYDAEYLARYGRDRPKPVENGKIILKP